MTDETPDEMPEDTWEESKERQMEELLNPKPNHEDVLSAEAVKGGDIKKRRTTLKPQKDGNGADVVDQSESLTPGEDESEDESEDEAK